MKLGSILMILSLLVVPVSVVFLRDLHPAAVVSTWVLSGVLFCWGFSLATAKRKPKKLRPKNLPEPGPRRWGLFRPKA